MKRSIRKVVGAVIVAAVCFGLTGAASAAEAELTVDVASAYVFRGATFNDGLVVQPGLSVSGLPVGLSVWGNLDIDDYDDALTGGEFSEIDIALSYDIPLSEELAEMFSSSLGYCEYTYPSGGGDADREVSLSAGLELPLSPSLSINYGIDGGIDETLYVEAGLEHEFAVEDVTISVGAALGYVDPEDGDAGFSHFTGSLGASYGIFSASVTYVGQIDDDVLPDVEDGGAYDVDLVAMIGAAYSF